MINSRKERKETKEKDDQNMGRAWSGEPTSHCSSHGAALHLDCVNDRKHKDGRRSLSLTCPPLTVAYITTSLFMLVKKEKDFETIKRVISRCVCVWRQRGYEPIIRLLAERTASISQETHHRDTTPGFTYALSFSSIGSVDQSCGAFCCSSHTKANAQLSILDLKTLLKNSSCSSVNMVFQSPTLPGLLQENKAEKQILICMNFSFSKKVSVFKLKE